MRLPPLLVVAGPTATGKTGLAIDTAGELTARGVAAEIVSADSRQVYRGLDIGTAKATPEQRRRVVHHGIDLVEPDEPFSVADFRRHALGALEALDARDGLGILAGGTGLWLRTVARGIDTDALPADARIRARIEDELARGGLAAAAARLVATAPRIAGRTDLRNPRRVARALEVAELRGDVDPPAFAGYPAPIAWIGLRVDDATHRDWIAARARAQFDAGLIEEARSLRERFDPELPAFSAIGYREAWSVLDGTATRDDAIEADARRNVAFAKRQRTWFRSEPDIEWVDPREDVLARAVERALGLVDRAKRR